MTPSSALAYGLLPDELRKILTELGQPAYRADQVWRWLYVQRTKSWHVMSNISGDLRAQLAERILMDFGQVQATAGSDAGPRKLLVALRDGEQIEEVLIPAQKRRTLCLSSQVGCRYRCAFCASGQNGFVRNLEAGEIVGQVLLAAHDWGQNPTHVVLMGVGEPLDNYDNVLKAVRIINDGAGLNIGARRITISTSGIIPGIRKLSDEGLQVELSVSLHAPDDALRSKLMPLNRKYPLPDLLAACREYTVATGRIITFEYTLIRGVNDSPEQARMLAGLLKSFPARVNLIPLSPVQEFCGRPPAAEASAGFIEILDRQGLNATLRWSQGRDIEAACGQLRARRRC